MIRLFSTLGLVLTTVLLGCPAYADTLDVGSAGSTYTSNSATRGYWYTAPVDHTITHLRVPSVGTGPQNIQVLSFTGNTPPPTFSASTTAHTTLFYTNSGTSANDWISVNIPVTAGMVIGILGARGTSTLSNAYGNGNPYSSTLGGAPVSLQRLVYQANLHNAQAGALSTESGGSYSRVEMQYLSLIHIPSPRDRG